MPFDNKPSCIFFDIFGSKLQIMSPLTENDADFCVLRMAIPTGVVVPLHAHADHKVLQIQSGHLQIMMDGKWQRLAPTDVIDIPAGKPHAFRNVSCCTVSTVITTTARLGRFFKRIGWSAVAMASARPQEHDFKHFAAACMAEGHWLGGAADNAKAGIGAFSFL